MLETLLIGLVVGIALVIVLRRWTESRRRTRQAGSGDPMLANLSAPGAIWNGNLTQFDTALDALFPGAPEQSFVSVGPYVDNWHNWETSSTGFFIMNVRGPKGRMGFTAELRLSGDWTQAAPHAQQLMAGLDHRFTRDAGPDGAVVLRSGWTDDLERLRAAAHRFATEHFQADQPAWVHVQWHCAETESEPARPDGSWQRSNGTRMAAM